MAGTWSTNGLTAAQLLCKAVAKLAGVCGTVVQADRSKQAATAARAIRDMVIPYFEKIFAALTAESDTAFDTSNTDLDCAVIGAEAPTPVSLKWTVTTPSDAVVRSNDSELISFEFFASAAQHTILLRFGSKNGCMEYDAVPAHAVHPIAHARTSAAAFMVRMVR